MKMSGIDKMMRRQASSRLTASLSQRHKALLAGDWKPMAKIPAI